MQQGRTLKKDRENESVALFGWYDIWRRDEFEAALDRIDPGDVVVLDLSQVQHIDCACLGLMLRKLNQWREKTPNVEVRLDNVGTHLQQMMKFLQLDQTFKCSARLHESIEPTAHRIRQSTLFLNVPTKAAPSREALR